MRGPSVSALRQFIVDAALAHIGDCYVFGGAPGIDGTGCTDCSGKVNQVIGMQAGQSIPGFPDGSYDGRVHGPSTLGWLGWQGQGVGSIDRSEVLGGDIACWQTHMGIAISNTEMVSAANPSQGTIRSGIDGFIHGEQLVCLRLAVIGPGGVTLPVPVLGGSTELNQITRDIARTSVNLVWKRMQVKRIRTGAF